MEENKYTTIITDYKIACNSMLKAFCERHDFIFEEDAWAGGVEGSIASVGDFYVDMQTIYYDVTELPDVDDFIKWYDYCNRLYAIGMKKNINYESWCKGAHRLPEESLARMESLRAELDRQIEEHDTQF